MTEDTGRVTRRQFVKAMGVIGGAGAAYHALTAMGLLDIPPASARTRPIELETGLSGVKIVVIGAGLAGLCAAYRAANAGAEVTVLEADKRYGGRSLTVRPEGDRPPSGGPTYVSEYEEWDWTYPSTCRWTPGKALYFNAGPGRIPQHHQLVLDYCRELEVKLEPYIFIDEANLLQSDNVFNGKPVPIRQIEFNLFGYIAEMLAKVKDPAMLNRTLDASDIEAFRGMLKSFGDLEKGQGGKLLFQGTPRAGYAIEPGAGLNAGKPLPQPSLAKILQTEFWETGLFADFRYYWQSSLLQPVLGMDAIWQAFLQQEVPYKGERVKLQSRVELNSPVTRIDVKDDKVHVTYKGKVESADYCISTMPPLLLGNLDGNLMDTQSRLILRGIENMPACKVGWQAKSRFWQKQNRIYGGISWTSDIISEMWYPSSGFDQDTGVLTGAYNRGWNAREFQQKTREERIEAALAGGEKLHPGFRDEVYRDTGLTIAWAKMPYQVGGWVNNPAENQPELYQQLNALNPLGNKVYLAGDYFSYLPGWQQGALDSAHLATDLIARRVSRLRRASKSRQMSQH